MTQRDARDDDPTFAAILEPLSSPGAQPDSEPFSGSLPFDWYWQPDYWRYLRLSPISGRYVGAMVTPTAGRYVLDLRVDIDLRYQNSPVLEKVSGDIYQVASLGRKSAWQTYRESWIVDSPTVTVKRIKGYSSVRSFRCQVEITGKVRYWKGIHPATEVQIIIPWGALLPAGPAEVVFTQRGISVSSYNCARKSGHFRNVELEVDVCSSVNAEPILPSYSTCAHSNRPADLPCRTLTVTEAYREAGIDLTISPNRTIIDDSAPEFSTWSDSELHDAMEQHFSQYSGTWPKWHMWYLFAGQHDMAGLLGIMFDYGAAYGGPGRSPERQGCALFRNHPSLGALVATPPANDAEAAALRELLKLYVHEVGHAFNFVHSWNKERPDSLSWMNYDWRYDNRNGAGSFWRDFRFRFDDEELIHLRHGDRSAVIPGGDPWASGSHSEAPPGAMADLVGDAPIELLLRSKDYFQFMEQVIVELRVRNTTDVPLELDTQLSPEFGGVIFHIRRPDGRVLEYAPIHCKLATPELKILKPAHDAVQGEDRHSQNIFLGYGIHGHCFDEPGEYMIRAFYQGRGDVLIPSNIWRLRVGRPFSPDDERIAQDFFTHEVGMALYLNGSTSPFLKKAMDKLETMADRYRNNPVGAYLSLVLAQNLTRPFFRIQDKKMVKIRDAKPEEALALSAKAVEQQVRDESTFTNITYHRLRRVRADLLATLGDKVAAKKELSTLAEDLKKRGVNQPVLDQIKAYAVSL